MYILWFNFIQGSNFNFPLFCGMVMYDNEFKTKENAIKPKKKVNHNIYAQ